jgi:hypothetical protein
MRLDPTLSVQDWADSLRAEGIRTWGEPWAEAQAESIKRLAASIQRVVSYPVATEEEPFLLAARPGPFQEV